MHPDQMLDETQKAKAEKVRKETNGNPKMEKASAPGNEGPTIAQVSAWTKEDLRAAIAFLNLINTNPHILDAVCGLIYEKAKGFDQNHQDLKTETQK